MTAPLADTQTRPRAWFETLQSEIIARFGAV